MLACFRSAWFVLSFFALAAAVPAHAQVLSGQVVSPEEGALEGVIVSAKRDGSTITVSAVSDAQGRYAFPAGRLEPGVHKLEIRAVGYELDGATAENLVAG